MNTTQTITPVQPPDQPKHSRTFRVLRAGGIGFAALIVISGTASALTGGHGTSTAVRTSTSAPAATPEATIATWAPVTPAATAPAATAPATTAPAIPAAQAAMDSWCAGSGYSDFQTVRADISQMQTDTGNNDTIAIEQDGGRLFNDAHTAGMNLPPKSDPHSFGYGMYMSYWMIGGYRASTGDFAAASAVLAKALPFKADAVAVDTACGGAGF